MTTSILIIDDFPLTLQFIEYHLEMAGYRNIATFENPLEAINHIQNGNNPQVVITDFQMPQMNGLELLEQIRNNFGMIPAIVTTADSNWLTPGFNQYPVLEKGAPGFIEELLNLIKKISIQCPSGITASTMV